MLNNAQAAFSSFSTDDLATAKKFYVDKLGLKLTDESMGLNLELPGGAGLFIYEKDDHQPATFTVLNFLVDDIEKKVGELKSSGIKFENISFGDQIKTDEKGIMRGKAANQGPDIAWFKDPAGNFIALMEQ